MTVTAIWKRKACEKQIAGKLRTLERELEDLIRSSEDDFLALGAKLQDFYMQMQEITGMSSSIAALLSGNEISGAISAFDSAFDRLEKTEGASGESLQALKNILGNLSEMQSRLDEFHRIIMFLRVLCVSTRMESARVGHEESGFGILGEEVAGMVREMESRHGQLQGHCELLKHLIERTLDRVLSIGAVRREQAERLSGSISSTLQALTDQQARSVASAEEMAARCRTISGSIGEIVSSMQFHDITRQRIEHAVESFLGLMDSKTAVEEKRWWKALRFLPERDRVEMKAAGGICRLQAAQLRQAAEELVGAVETIVENLAKLSANISEILEEARMLGGSSGEVENSFFTALEREVSAMLTALSGYGAAGREFSSAMSSAGTTLGDMEQFAGAIRGIGTKTKLIALNAIVKASHMNEEGSALAVLADSIHHLSIESCGCIESVSASLEAITTGSAAIVDANRQEIKDEAGGESTGLVLRSQTDALRTVSESVSSLQEKLQAAVDALSNEMRQSAAAMGVHRRVAGVMNAAAGELEEIAEIAQRLIPGDRLSDDARQLKELEASYTMEKEREIHHAIITGAATATAAMQEKPAESGETQVHEEDRPDDADLGDNVELF